MVFNFPSLRYAGYLIVTLVIIFPFSLYLGNKIDFSKKKFKQTHYYFFNFLLNFLVQEYNKDKL